MFCFRIVASILFGLTGILISGLAAQAADPDLDGVLAGQLITAGATLNVRAGPGTGYIVVDTVGPGDSYIISGECRNNWCEVDQVGEDGWIYFADAYAEGWEPDEPIGSSHLNWDPDGPGEVCFYDGPDYTGASLCLTGGINYPDLGAVGRDNWISSVRVTGNVSATICRDANYRSYCIMAVQDQPHLGRFLDNQVTSITIH